MNNTHTFFLTFTVLTIVYGILLLKMRKVFIEQIKELRIKHRAANYCTYQEAFNAGSECAHNGGTESMTVKQIVGRLNEVDDGVHYIVKDGMISYEIPTNVFIEIEKE